MCAPWQCVCREVQVGQMDYVAGINKIITFTHIFYYGYVCYDCFGGNGT